MPDSICRFLSAQILVCTASWHWVTECPFTTMTQSSLDIHTCHFNPFPHTSSQVRLFFLKASSSLYRSLPLGGSLVIIPLSDVSAFLCHLLSKRKNPWNKHFPLIPPQWKIFLPSSLYTVSLNTGGKVQLFKKQKQKISFKGMFWVNLCLHWDRLCVCVADVCVYEAKVQSLCCSIADWNQDFRVNGQGDCCLLDLSAFVTRSAHRSYCCHCPQQGNTAAEYV